MSVAVISTSIAIPSASRCLLRDVIDLMLAILTLDNATLEASARACWKASCFASSNSAFEMVVKLTTKRIFTVTSATCSIVAQSDSAVLPAGEVLSSLHAEHWEELASLLYLPGLQAVHTPPLGPVLPTLHRQSVLSSLPFFELEPEGQA